MRILVDEMRQVHPTGQPAKPTGQPFSMNLDEIRGYTAAMLVTVEISSDTSNNINRKASGHLLQVRKPIDTPPVNPSSAMNQPYLA